MNRRWLPAVLAATLVLLPGTAAAAPQLLWSLEVSPTTVPVTQPTTFTLTVSNLLLLRLGCLEVDLTSEFEIDGVEMVSVSNGQSWSATFNGHVAVVRADASSGRLGPLGSATFTIDARPEEPGSFDWPNHAHTRADCNGTNQSGIDLQVTVQAAPSTPSPTASPSPTPKPTATATPTPTLPLPSLPLPSLPLPSLLPTPLPTVVPTPRPTTPAATPTPTPSPTPAPSASDEAQAPDRSPSPDNLNPPPGASPSSGAPDPVGTVRLAPDAGRSLDTAVDIALGDLLADVQLWSVPAVAVGVPGLLLIVWVALQAAGVLAWLPAVRRMRGDESDPRRRRRR